MYDLDLARLIHADREREMERERRVHAVRQAKADVHHDTYVPRPSDQPGRLTHALRLVPGSPRGS